MVKLGEDHPRPFVIETEARLGSSRNLDGEFRVRRRRVRHREDGDHLVAGLGGSGQEDGAGSVLATLFVAGLCFVTPEVGVADDETWNRIRDVHASGLDLLVERGGLGRRARRAHAFGDVVRNLAEGVDLAVTALEAEIFSVRQEHEAIMPMMRDRDGAFESLAAEADERLRDFDGTGGLGHWRFSYPECTEFPEKFQDWVAQNKSTQDLRSGGAFTSDVGPEMIASSQPTGAMGCTGTDS